jgi:hypothetical protein
MVVDEYLDANVISAGIAVKIHRSDGGIIAPGDQGVYEPIPSAASKVIIIEPESAKILDVVWQRQVGGQVGPAQRPSLASIGGRDHGLFGKGKLVRTACLPGLRQCALG